MGPWGGIWGQVWGGGHGDKGRGYGPLVGGGNLRPWGGYGAEWSRDAAPTRTKTILPPPILPTWCGPARPRLSAPSAPLPLAARGWEEPGVEGGQ